MSWAPGGGFREERPVQTLLEEDCSATPGALSQSDLTMGLADTDVLHPGVGVFFKVAQPIP